MDPFTIWLCGMATLWLIRRGVEDCIAAFTGKESPRMIRLRERRAANRVTIWEELGDVVVALIRRRNRRRPLGPAGRYLAELWVDAWDDALAAHNRRRRRRAAADPPPKPGPTPAPDLDDDTDVIDAEWYPVDDEPADQSDPPRPAPPPPTAPPNPAGTTLRKALAMSGTTTVVVDGDVISPLTALAFATGSLDLNDAVQAQLESMMLNLRGAKLSPSVLAQVGAVVAAADQFRAATWSARGEYAKHVAAQAEIAGDVALRDTVYRTYLDTANL